MALTVDARRSRPHGGGIVVAPAGAGHRFTASGEGTLRFVSTHPAPAMSQEFVG